MHPVEVAASPECATLADLRDQPLSLIRMYRCDMFVHLTSTVKMSKLVK